MMPFEENTPVRIFALPGFLGRAQDWTPFDVINHPLDINHTELDFWAWARSFNACIAESPGKNILIGYSLGGRLAMHALLSSPDLWNGAILVSAHPGLTSDKERALRRETDRQWSERFLRDPWESLMGDWNKNPVFGDAHDPFCRKESECNRKKLSEQLVNWSLGNQEPLLDRLRTISVPMLILAGKLDPKFCTIAEQFHEFAKVAVVSGAAHRVPWDQPTQFTSQISQFIASITCKQ